MFREDDDFISDKERWADDHGYARYRCRIHGTFHSDSNEGCPSCAETDVDEPSFSEELDQDEG